MVSPAGEVRTPTTATVSSAEIPRCRKGTSTSIYKQQTSSPVRA